MENVKKAKQNIPPISQHDGHIFAHIFITMLSNNDILKKLRVALSLKNDDIIKILKLADFEISKGALGDLFRDPDHPGYEEAGNQILRHFLNGLIIYKRGKLEKPKIIKGEEDLKKK